MAGVSSSGRLRLKCLAGFLGTLLVVMGGCGRKIELLPATFTAPPTCAFKVVDERPMPEMIWMTSPENQGPDVVQPPVAEALRRSVCRALSAEKLGTVATFVVTDFGCNVSGFWELTVVGDVRGRLEQPGSSPTEFRNSNVTKTHDSVLRTACGKVAGPAVHGLAVKIVEAMSKDGR